VKVDERFLSVHPRTLLWWQQREQCRKCKHHWFKPEKPGSGHSGSGGGEYCEATRYSHDKTCVSARDTDCGSEAALFEAKP